MKNNENKTGTAIRLRNATCDKKEADSRLSAQAQKLTTAVRKLGVVLLMCAVFNSCDDDNNGSTPYNPGQAITLQSFSPEEGGMASKIVISGNNLGNDPSIVKVWFNQKQAPVIGCDNGRILALAPRQPGDICEVSVVIGKDSVVFDKTFTYHTTTTVTTIVGQKGSTAFLAGAFAEATFVNPAFLGVDNEKNLFLANWGGEGGGNIVFISQESRTVTELVASCGRINVPTTDITGNIILMPHDSDYTFYMFDPDELWTPRKRLILRPTADEIAAGKKDFSINWKHGFGVCKLDGMIYTRAWDGQLIRFDPFTRKGEQIATNIMPSTDGYVAFDPVNQHMLYLCYADRHCIYTYNILTGEHTRFAGIMGSPGWKDGERLDAQLSYPRQFVFDQDNNIILADDGNHCIRKITPDGMVSTIIGMGGKSGYQDGNPDDALFNAPRGVAIDNEHNIYIADYGNNCVRKLAIE